MACNREPARILCFGDSNTWGADPAGGGRLPAAARWTGVLAGALGPGHAVIEEGMRGRTTALDDPMVPGGNGASYLAPCLVSHQPLDLVILMLGNNDLKDRFGQSAADVAENVARLVELIRAAPIEGPSDRKPPILLVAPPKLGPRGPGFAAIFAKADPKSAVLSDALGAVAARANVAFFDAGSVVGISGGDGVHFAAPEHAKLGHALAPLALRLLRA
ncbi:hypothetical protein DWF00_14955 [Bosea caraganae]|uniref:SGNH hydrolase-type esterase domain-containing protein n=1 Tax=Bosea caraganae TaxID=2763117 RepID=A0A370L6Y0_9HYPH|nr:SGNH/GDSL hydrolase family protein [Bosea caraganae]RDJ25517.1 hypothetical protein DWE98_12430 [Bosea caraganae]RDJ25696.1 hypothetical protein DWF00_14955 [Bosea caraganae]